MRQFNRDYILQPSNDHEDDKDRDDDCGRGFEGDKNTDVYQNK